MIQYGLIAANLIDILVELCHVLFFLERPTSRHRGRGRFKRVHCIKERGKAEGRQREA